MNIFSDLNLAGNKIRNFLIASQGVQLAGGIRYQTTTIDDEPHGVIQYWDPGAGDDDGQGGHLGAWVNVGDSGSGGTPSVVNGSFILAPGTSASGANTVVNVSSNNSTSSTLSVGYSTSLERLEFKNDTSGVSSAIYVPLGISNNISQHLSTNVFGSAKFDISSSHISSVGAYSLQVNIKHSGVIMKIQEIEVYKQGKASNLVWEKILTEVSVVDEETFTLTLSATEETKNYLLGTYKVDIIGYKDGFNLTLNSTTRGDD